jgi:hypothetical protein
MPLWNAIFAGPHVNFRCPHACRKRRNIVPVLRVAYVAAMQLGSHALGNVSNRGWRELARLFLCARGFTLLCLPLGLQLPSGGTLVLQAATVALAMRSLLADCNWCRSEDSCEGLRRCAQCYNRTGRDPQKVALRQNMLFPEHVQGGAHIGVAALTISAATGCASIRRERLQGAGCMGAGEQPMFCQSTSQ